MAKHCLYGVYATVGSKQRFALTRNKRLAIRTAKHYGGTVRSFGSIPGPEYSSFDAPTFRVLSSQIYPEVNA